MFWFQGGRLVAEVPPDFEQTIQSDKADEEADRVRGDRDDLLSVKLIAAIGIDPARGAA